MGQHKSLLVGFGGTGGKTLKEFAVKISEDYEASKRAQTDFAFLLCDTDTDDLRKHKLEIEEALNPILKEPPIIRTLSLAGGLGDRRFSEETAYILGYPERNAHERIREAWWFQQSGEAQHPEPFLARTLTAPITKGAGQCPMVSFFLSWALVDELDRLVGTILDELQRRSLNSEKQSLTINTHLISGLSGGTGRGCWPVLGLKIYEKLQSKGFLARPRGIFLDASVYADVQTGGGPSQFMKQQVNALTGTSELIAWLRNHKTPQQSRGDFALPDFRTPHDKMTDKVALSLLKTVKDAPGGPVEQAFLITSESKAGKVGQGHILSMVATALYAQVTQDSIGQVEINETTRNFGSLGAASYFVPATKIRNFLAKNLKLRCAQDLISVNQSKVDLAKNSVLKCIKLSSSSTKSSSLENQKSLNKSLRSVSPKDVAALQAEFKNLLAKQDVKKCTIFINSLALRYGKTGGTELPKHVEMVLLEMVGGAETSKISPTKILEKSFLEICDNQGLSLAEMQKCLIFLKNEIAQLKNDGKINQETNQTRLLIAKIERLGKKRIPVFGNNFDPVEIDELVKDLDGVIKECRGPALAEIFATEIQKVIDAIDSWSESLQKFINQLDLEAGFQSETQSKENDLTRERANLFTINDGQKLDAGHTLFKGGHIIDRLIKPVLTDRDLEELLSNLAQKSPEVRQLKQEILKFATDNSIGTGEVARGLTPANKEKLLELVTQLKNKIQVNPDQIAKQFGFCNVIDGLLNYWVDGLNNLNLEQKERDNLLLKFLDFFGCPLTVDNATKKVIKPSLIDILESMVVSLGSTCDPFIRFERESRDHDIATIFFPSEDNFRSEFNNLKDRLGLDNKNTGRQAEQKLVVDLRQSNSPFSLIAYVPVWIDISQASNGGDAGASHYKLDDVTSLNYWKTNSLLTMWLQDAEDPNGKSLFNPPLISYGFGYVWPGFVRDKKWREMRWRPWAASLEQNAETAQKHEAQRHLEAAIWGLTMLSSNHFEKINTGVEGISEIENTYRETEALQSSSMNSIFLRKMQKEFSEFCKQPLIMGPCLTGAPWQITRNAMTEEEGKVEPGSSSEDRMPGKESYSSLRHLISDFKSKPNIAARFMKERDLFDALLARDEEYPASARQQFKLWLLLRTQKLLDAEIKRVDVLSNKETLTPVVKQLIDVVRESIQTLKTELSTR